jgi:hypothetical protein
MIHTFIISHERIFPIEKEYYKWDEEVIINGADPFHTENKELGLLKKKDSIYFDSKRYGSPRITEYTSLGTKLSRIPVAKYIQELGLEVN